MIKGVEMELADLNPIIRKVMQRENLSVEETKDSIMTILEKDTTGYFYLAFVTALTTKGETADELFGFYKAIEALSPKIKTGINSNNLIDLSGTGGAKLKTINVSTAASFVVAGSGVKVSKQAQFGITSLTGSADIFSTFGIDVRKCGEKQLVEGLDKVGIMPSYYMFFSPGFKNRAELNKKIIGENKLGIRTPFHLVAFTFSPIVEMKRRIYGVFDEKFLPVLVEVFQKAGYERGMVFSGIDGLCEVSNIGNTRIIEFKKNKQETYQITPEDLGLKKSKYEDIKGISKDQNIIDFIEVLYNKNKGAKRDIVLANAAAAFYTLEKVSDLKEGVEMARTTIEDGKASKKLEELVEFVGDKGLLQFYLGKAGL